MEKGTEVMDSFCRLPAQNLTHFRINYILLLFLVLFFSLIYHPSSLIIFFVIFIAWVFLYLAREEALLLCSYIITDRVVVAALFAVTVFRLVLTGVWVNVLVASVIRVGLVVLHTALRSIDDLVMDDLESPYEHVLDDDLDSPRGDYSGI
ncbi:hypothetical protein SLEP1_g56521 [Rubroshorea leprosula]|uniref:PRA1 family protein n=1 Tax=Rubroshorea leprosula TaxID=152421 RepID=A0AAV5MIJ9_9ROSI|nr:hypothetical protein SLEP1_g56521 [Rubroshorea leprosula]